MAQTKWLLRVVEQRLTGHVWIMGDEYTISDMTIDFPDRLNGGGWLLPA